MNNDWINKLREEEQHFEMQAPEGLWENIQRDLTKDIDSADNSNAEKSASAKGNLRLKRILIAAAACALALVCFKLTMNNTDALKETEIAKARTPRIRMFCTFPSPTLRQYQNVTLFVDGFAAYLVE